MKFSVLSLFLFFGVASFGQDSLECRLISQFNYAADLNDVWGYTNAEGREFALVGKTNGFSVVDLDSSAGLVERILIPGPSSVWRDIKTWEHYAYVVHDGVNPGNGIGVGLMIVDLDSLSTPRYRTFYPQVTLWNNTTQLMTRAHNIYIDENGILYLFGSNVGVGGAIMMDLSADPWNPVVVGSYDGSYYHDGYARNDTLYGAALQNGIEILDVTFKPNPQFVNSFQTPNSFAHNCWLSDDSKTLYTTDEVSGGYIGVYNIADRNNVTEWMRHRVTSPSSQIIPHNAHVKGDFVVTSYYTFGLHILDSKYPEYVVMTSYYDTSPFSGGTFNGAWGAYPYLPSGRILITDIEEGLFVLESSYPEAARIKGIVTDSVSGTILPNAQVTLTSGIHSVINPTTAKFKAARMQSGWDTLNVVLSGYQPYKRAVYLDVDSFPELEVKLIPFGVGLEEASTKQGLVCYPNPGSSRVNYTLNIPAIEGDFIRLIDLQGNVIYDRHLESGLVMSFLETNYLPSGVYFIELSSSGSVERHKWIKN